MVISRPIQQNKVLLDIVPEEKVKPLTQPERIKEWIQYNPNDFIAGEVQEAFPEIMRRTIEKSLKALVVAEYITSKKCRCGCANIYKKTHHTPAPEWT